ncbi:MAG: T9SS type A sorting domain-containing protein [Ignavibacteria bacterium]|nr:T9SS type A sorting domain-containing protein [Ignavibacteria bacterium]
MMQKFLFLAMALLFLPSVSFCENVSLFGNVQTTQSENLNAKFSKEVNSPVFLSVNKESVRQILNSDYKTLNIDIPLDGNNSANLKLSEYKILTPGAVIMEETADGRKTIPANVRFKCYTGFYNNDMNSLVIMCFADNFVKALLLTDNNSYTLATLEDETRLSNECILYANNKILRKNNFHCAADELPLSENTKRDIQNLRTESLTNTFLQANIALEVDNFTYNLYGQSSQNVSAYCLSLLSVSSALYNRDINVKFVVPSIHIWTTSDPYNATTSSGLLNQFRTWWNANMQAAPRTLAHFITRRAGNLGGIAWIDVLCASASNGYGYGFSNTDGPINPLPTYSWDAMVVSHEIGHNFSSPHTHSCTWPGGMIDSCYTPEGTCYTGPAIPRPGTIMSYCHLTSAGIDLRLGFGPLPKAKIRQGAENAGCMNPAPEAVLLSYPQGGETYYTNTQQYVYWGTSSASNFNIELTTNSGSSWITIASNVPGQNHYYVWTVPYIPTSPNCRLRIIDASNPSVGDTVNQNFTVKLVLNSLSLISPAASTTILTSTTDTSRVVFNWSSTGAISGAAYKWKLRKVSGATLSFPSDSNGTATRITVRKSRLDSLAKSLGLTGDSIYCVWSSSVYVNSDSAGSDTRFLVIKSSTVGVNNISSTIPAEYKLHSNYPNPFNPVTKIKFEIPKDEFVKIKVFDLSGKEVSSLVNEKLKAGIYEASFNAASLASGTYFYKIETSSYIETRKMVLLK